MSRAVQDSRGFTLIEVLLALFLIGLGLLAAAPMFVYAMQGNATGADFGSVGALAVEQMETLRSQPYSTLAAGGDIATPTAGYTMTVTDFQVNITYTINWEIVDNASPVGTKTITLRAVADRQLVGRPKEVVLTSVRGR
jgi:prepilin-type N-terminal cleavage/methylation domain-containing protein